MPLYLKQSTAVTLKIGPFMDDTDGKTPETGLTIAQASVRLSKNGGDIAQKSEATSCTHDELGIYGCPLNTTDTNTLGRLQLWVSVSGALMFFAEFMVITAEAYDTLCGSDRFTVDLYGTPTVNVTQISGDSAAADNLESYCDGTTPQPVNVTQIAGSAVATGSAQLGVNVVNWKGSAAPNMTGDAYARLGAPAGASVSADVAAVKSDTGAILTDTNEIQTDLTNGGRLDLILDAILEDTGTTLPGTLSTIDGKVDTIDGIADSIVVDTNELQSDWANGGRLDLLIDSIISTLGAAGAGLTALPWNAAWDAEVQSECADALNAYDPPTNAEMEARTIAAADYATATAVATVDGVVDAIKVTTDKLDDTLELDTDVYRFTENALEQAPSGTGASAASIADAVWDELLSGHTDAGSAGAGLSAAGSAGDPWSTALPGSYGAGTAGKIIGDNLDAAVSSRASQTSVDTIDGIVDAILEDTGATLPGTLSTISGYIDTEIASILEDTGTTIPGLIGALNNLSAQQVWEYATRILTAATNLNIPTAAANADAVWDEARSGHTAAGSFGQGVASVQGNVTGSVASVTAGVTVSTNNDKTGYSLSTTPPTAAQIRQEIDSNSTQLAAIVADTNELQGDLANGGRLDLLIDAILEDTGTTVPTQISGLNNLSAQQVWEYATRVLTAATNLAIPSASDIKTALEAAGSHLALILEDTGTTLPASLSAIAAYIDTEVAAILEDTGTTIPGLIGALNNISVDDVLDEAVEGTVTLRQAIRGIMSVLMAKASGGGTSTLVYRDLDDTKPRVTITADENGVRSAVTLDLT